VNPSWTSLTQAGKQLFIPIILLLLSGLPQKRASKMNQSYKDLFESEAALSVCYKNNKVFHFCDPFWFNIHCAVGINDVQPRLSQPRFSSTLHRSNEFVASTKRIVIAFQSRTVMITISIATTTILIIATTITFVAVTRSEIVSTTVLVC